MSKEVFFLSWVYILIFVSVFRTLEIGDGFVFFSYFMGYLGRDFFFNLGWFF